MIAQELKPKTTYLKDYTAPDFFVELLELTFELGEEKTIVHSRLKCHRNFKQGTDPRPLVLQGDSLKLVSLSKNGNALEENRYQATPNELRIHEVPDKFSLDIVTEIYPQKNTALMGLYRSGNMFCTQCEPEGFRRITYYLDRPDVMAPFTTTIIADKTKYPVLLSNGNKIGEGEYDNNRHWVKWQDPFKKPSYLFALVAGPLSKISDTFTTMSGRKVALEIFVEPENIKKCDYAMRSLIESMKWDEQKYGLEYDLDIYMIVAVNDFNMGAMENKGLNIFNSKYVLADEKMATDIDFQNIEAVIGHEYFHNWTGNRVTCRDWFQLSLKEGLTVFREQQFSADMGSPVVKRIQDVKIIRSRQFAEDAGPMAHPVQPASYMEINNFYTATIYNKGAEVIRMLHTLLGEQRFRKGMDLYFERHDGQAVTIQDFVAAFADANDYDLEQFKGWYHQAGTPEVHAEGHYDPTKKQFTLDLTQSWPPTPDKLEKQPLMIPIKISLLSEEGNTFPLHTKERLEQTEAGHFLILDQKNQTFVFDNITSTPIPSLLGNFSAPVKLIYPYTPDELSVILNFDPDQFNRWDASQQLCLQAISDLMQAYHQKEPLTIPEFFIDAYANLLSQPVEDAQFFAQLLSIPSFSYIAQTLPYVDVDALIKARKTLLEGMAKNYQGAFEKLYLLAQRQDTGSFDADSMGYRALKNTCLYYLAYIQSPKGLELVQKQFESAKNMTDSLGALNAINDTDVNLRTSLFDKFYDNWKKEYLVVNKWLTLQATSQLSSSLKTIKELMHHESFDISNPNKVYALLSGFGASNSPCFHDDQGQGYDFLADRVIELNGRNPQVASHVLNALTHWKRLDEKHGALMKKALQKIQQSGPLSKDVNEIITKSLIE